MFGISRSMTNRFNAMTGPPRGLLTGASRSFAVLYMDFSQKAGTSQKGLTLSRRENRRWASAERSGR
jgi:hypothetical protein